MLYIEQSGVIYVVEVPTAGVSLCGDVNCGGLWEHATGTYAVLCSFSTTLLTRFLLVLLVRNRSWRHLWPVRVQAHADKRFHAHPLVMQTGLMPFVRVVANLSRLYHL